VRTAPALLWPEDVLQFVGHRSEAFRRCLVWRSGVVVALLFGDERDTDPLLGEINAQDLEWRRHARRDDRRPVLRSCRRERGCVRERFDSGFELDERAELRDARNASSHDLTHRVLVFHP
jgi:hypothetical protein